MTSNQQIVQILANANDVEIAKLIQLAGENDEVAAQIVQIIDTNNDEELKSAAIRILGLARRELLVKPFKRMLDHQDYDQRSTAAYITGILKLTALKADLENQLRKDDSADVRYWCVAALGQIGDLTSLPLLESYTQDEGWADNQETVASAAQNAIQTIRQRSRLRPFTTPPSRP